MLCWHNELMRRNRRNALLIQTQTFAASHRRHRLYCSINSLLHILRDKEVLLDWSWIFAAYPLLRFFRCWIESWNNFLDEQLFSPFFFNIFQMKCTHFEKKKTIFFASSVCTVFEKELFSRSWFCFPMINFFFRLAVFSFLCWHTLVWKKKQWAINEKIQYKNLPGEFFFYCVFSTCAKTREKKFDFPSIKLLCANCRMSQISRIISIAKMENSCKNKFLSHRVFHWNPSFRKQSTSLNCRTLGAMEDVSRFFFSRPDYCSRQKWKLWEI